MCRFRIFENRPSWNDLSRIDHFLTDVVMPFNVICMAGLSDSVRIINVASMSPEILVLINMLTVALEVAVIN